jgi:hypothetical protein
LNPPKKIFAKKKEYLQSNPTADPRSKEAKEIIYKIKKKISNKKLIPN